MLSIKVWALALVAAAGVTALTATAQQTGLHMAVAGGVCLAIAIRAIIEHQRLIAGASPASAIAASSARYLGLVWAWGALALLITYTAVLDKTWHEWWQFFLGFLFAAAASMYFANMLSGNNVAAADDDILVRIGRVLAQVQIAGMAAGIVSLFVDGKFPRGVQYPDWAGCNIFFFGALAIAAISLDALRTPRRV